MTQTPNLGLMKPSESDLFSIAAFNQNADIIDDAFGSRSYQVGDMAPYEGINPPTGWLPCDGREIDPEVYPNLAPHCDIQSFLDIKETRFMDGCGNPTHNTFDSPGNKVAVQVTEDEVIIGMACGSTTCFSRDFFKTENYVHPFFSSNSIDTIFYIKETATWVGLITSTNGRLIVTHTTDPYGEWTKVKNANFAVNGVTVALRAIYSMAYIDGYYYLSAYTNKDAYRLIEIRLKENFTVDRVSIILNSSDVSGLSADNWLYVSGSYSKHSNRIDNTMFDLDTDPNCEYFIGVSSGKVVRIVKRYYDQESSEFVIVKNDTALNIPNTPYYTVDATRSSATYLPNFNGEEIIAITTRVTYPISSYRTVGLLILSTSFNFIKHIFYSTDVHGNKYGDTCERYMASMHTVRDGYMFTLSTTGSTGYTAISFYLNDLDDVTTSKRFILNPINDNKDFYDYIFYSPLFFKIGHSIYCLYRKQCGLYNSLQSDSGTGYLSAIFKMSEYRLPNKPGYIIKAS